VLIRLRLTLFYSALFTVSGAALLTITYLLLRFAVPPVLAHSLATPRTSGHGPRLTPLPSLASMKAAADRQRANDQHQLLVVGGIALVVMALLSLFACWLAAGRVLRPLRAITAAARDLSSTDLHRRLALTGPADELKELGDTFDALIGRLERSFNSQRQFVANASHELRTPLTLSRALLEAALLDPAASLPETCERLLTVNAQQERLIESLLTLATSERGIQHWSTVDLTALARSAVLSRTAALSRSAVAAGQADVDASFEPAFVLGDPDLCGRLIANLLDNALRYNLPTGGVVAVSTGGSWFRIRNTGPVVADDQVDELFEPFRRLGGRSSDGNHGLGLSIVSAIAAAHQATVTATAQTGGGLDILVRFKPADYGG
jgi:signal transduction histidine kinase